MRHLKHRNQLGVKKEHRISLMANLAASLIKEGRIKTTLKKAKALRPFAERLVTLAKKGTLHHRRLAVARVRDRDAVRILFDERVEEFRDRPGGYTRIYKIGTRLGDAAEMGIIEWISGSDDGYKSTRRKAKPKAAAAVSTEEKPAEEKPAGADEKPAGADEKPPAEAGGVEEPSAESPGTEKKGE